MTTITNLTYTREDLSLRQTHLEGRMIQAVSHFKSCKLFSKKLRFGQLGIVQLAEQPQVMICKHQEVCLGSNPSASSLICCFVFIITFEKHLGKEKSYLPCKLKLGIRSQ